MLQWGRGLSTPEVSSASPPRRKSCGASMGPGSFDPGSIAMMAKCKQPRRSFNGAGVFRPRKCRRPVVAYSYTAASMGPGSFDPGSDDLGSCGVLLLDRLQWGRGLSTPEVRGFPGGGAGGGLLQWGRGLSTPEVSTCAASASQPKPLQWGRGLSTPEVVLTRCGRSGPPRFNGAGVFRPRKFEVVVELAPFGPVLQWGRGLSTPEVCY